MDKIISAKEAYIGTILAQRDLLKEEELLKEEAEIIEKGINKINLMINKAMSEGRFEVKTCLRREDFIYLKESLRKIIHTFQEKGFSIVCYPNLANTNIIFKINWNYH